MPLVSCSDQDAGNSNHTVLLVAGAGGLEQIPEGKPVAADAAHAGVEDKPKKEPLLARLSHSLMRRGSTDKAPAHEAAAAVPSFPQPVAAH